MDIDSWLRGIGLAQYAEMFRANDIDFMILRELTDQDLEKMGVARLRLKRRTVRQMGSARAELGDGLMSLFGYPVAQENDSERAVRAALAIQRALAELNRKNAGSGKPVLNARIGLETGPVVVDASGEIFGDAPNVAARVQALAEPGAVLVTARVQRQVAGLFVAEERGSHTLKGVPEPVTLFRLVRASGGGRRSGQRNLTPLVGRDDETAILMRRASRHSATDGPRAQLGARRAAPPAIGGADELGDRGRKGAAGGAGVRGSALGRSDHA